MIRKVEFLGVSESVVFNPAFYFGGKQNEKLLRFHYWTYV